MLQFPNVNHLYIPAMLKLYQLLYSLTDHMVGIYDEALDQIVVFHESEGGS